MMSLSPSREEWVRTRRPPERLISGDALCLASRGFG